jgi:hypothetical protein
MKKSRYFNIDDELLTVEEQKIKERQQYMGIGFFIGILTYAIGVAAIIYFS